MLLGSANFTRRNLRNYNLETSVAVNGNSFSPAIVEARNYIDMLWTNPDGRFFTTGYEDYADDSLWKVVRYRLKEMTGLCTW